MLMHPGMIYAFPIWQIGALMVTFAALGAMAIEVTARRFVSVEVRRRHNDVAAAMFSIIGVTYAVLLAFVAMLAWEGFNKAKAASYTEAASILDVYTVAEGFPDPTGPSLRDDIIGYVRAVVNVEWPAQAQGRIVDPGAAYLDRLNRTAFTLQPSEGAGGDLHAALLQSLTRLSDAREDRLLAAESSIPGVVWVVTVLGGALTIAFSSFLGAPSLRLHLAMVAVLAISGALVLILIIALSNPFRGDFRVSTKPFDRVLAHMTQ